MSFDRKILKNNVRATSLKKRNEDVVTNTNCSVGERKLT